jgi:hypothetical protein
MAEVTLEELVKRVEALEKRYGVLPSGAIPLKPRFTARPGKGDLVAALEAVKNLTDYDFDAVLEMDAADIEEQKRDAEKWG